MTPFQQHAKAASGQVYFRNKNCKRGKARRICISPKAKAQNRLFEGDWVGWVGTWDDLIQGNSGQYFFRLKDNTKHYDTSYPGVEILPNGTFVTTTYGHWSKGQPPYILSSRFQLQDLDNLANKEKK